MGRFLAGLVLGFLTSGIVLSVLSIVFPFAPSQSEASVGETAAVAPQPAPSAPAPAVTAPIPDPAPDAAPDPAPVTVPTITPQPEAGSVAPQPQPQPQPQPDQGSTEIVVATPTAPATSDAPSVGGGPSISLGGGDSLSSPSAPALGSPGLGAEGSGGISAGAGDSSPLRVASAPQQVSVGTVSAAAPTVNTETVAVPTIGGAELEAEPEPSDGEFVILNESPLVPGQALISNSADFNGDVSRPLMSIILIDEGADKALRAGLVSLTSPITFGVAANYPGATDAALQYRNNGYEVVAVLPAAGPQALNADTAAQDLSALISGTLDKVPVASTLLEPVGGPIPRNRDLLDAAVEVLQVTGHGLLTHRGNGLNNVPQIAAEAEVVSDLVYRVIDADTGAANVALALERAALDASRNGSVIVVGHVRPETVTTLFSWLLGSGSKSVTIAPVSTVLRAKSS